MERNAGVLHYQTPIIRWWPEYIIAMAEVALFTTGGDSLMAEEAYRPLPLPPLCVLPRERFHYCVAHCFVHAIGDEGLRQARRTHDVVCNLALALSIFCHRFLLTPSP